MPDPRVIKSPAPARSEKPDDEVIRSLSRGMEVLQAFGDANGRLTIADAAKATGQTRSAARRMLLTFKELGYVRMDGRYYTLTSRVLELGRGYLAQPLWQMVRPALMQVAHALGETASAAVLDGEDVVYSVRERSSRIIQLELRVGAKLPAYACSIGQVLLAALPSHELDQYLRRTKFMRFTRYTITDPDALRKKLERVRKQGWCHVRDEMADSVSGVAVPLLDPSGQTIAALNVSTNDSRSPPEKVKTTIVPLLQEAAATIRRELAAQG
jgi:IclR family transcriptional regulator, pca regulon regulatory protein